MLGFMSYFGGRRDPKQSARDAIVTLRQQLQMIEKKEEYLQKKIDTELKAARANAVTNKAGTLLRPTRHLQQWNGAAPFARASCTLLTYI
ncbi:hypothetical protein BDN71DRAFT_1440710 [Pleurotus eryngii]|uniref:Uncharacterized protein n=1 Tax=Pleurotus eryngii TaxID=5323 RepID=A0A9P6A574_PLEER|nr:hypothetical protein BDN71DRAFT_1440710 [Pleurotus eryngii]